MPEYLGQAPLSAAAVPARGAYLFRAGSRAGFRRSVQEASTRWGGITEPIVPVSATGRLAPLWSQVVQTANVDGLVNVDLDLGIAQAVSRRLDLPLVELQHIDRAGPLMWTAHPSQVSSWAGADSTPVVAEETGALWQAVAAGDVSVDHEADAVASSLPFWRVGGDQLARAQVFGKTLLARTLVEFGEHYGSGGPAPFSAVLWFTKPNSLRDCLFFWNVRALAPTSFPHIPMLLLPTEEVQHWLNFGEQVRQLLRRPAEFSPDVSVLSLSRSDAQLHDEAAALGLERSKVPASAGHRWPAELRTEPFTYKLGVDPLRNLVYGRRYGLVTTTDVQLVRTKTTARFKSPVQPEARGYTLLRMSSPAFASYPRRQVVASSLIRNATWRDDALQIATNLMSDYWVELELPALPAVAELLLTTSAATHRLSDKGRIGLPVAEAPTGFSALLQPYVYEVIAGLTTPRSSSLLRELQRLRDGGESDEAIADVAARWGGRVERRYRAASEIASVKALRAADVLEQLCSLGWVERGLEIACGTCGLNSLIALTAEAARPRCPGCGSHEGYTKAGPQLKVCYRLTTLIDRVSDQGLLPPLMAIAQLSRRNPDTYLIPGIDLAFPDGTKGELDLYGVHAAQVVAGEVKTSAKAFSDAQIRRDVDLSARVGADVHLMVALDEIPADRLAVAQKRCSKSGLQLLSLSGRELRESP